MKKIITAGLMALMATSASAGAIAPTNPMKGPKKPSKECEFMGNVGVLMAFSMMAPPVGLPLAIVSGKCLVEEVNPYEKKNEKYDKELKWFKKEFEKLERRHPRYHR